jgi:hypothetical protein
MEKTIHSMLLSIAAIVLGTSAVQADPEQVHSDTAAAAAYASVVPAKAREPKPADPETKPAAKPVVQTVSVLKTGCQCGEGCKCKSGYKPGDKVEHPNGTYELKWVWIPKVAAKAYVNPRPKQVMQTPSGWDCSSGTCKRRW